MYFTDTHVQIVSKGVLEPGEQLVSRSVVVDAPWYTFGMWLFHKTYLVLATNQRLVMVEHSRDFFNRGMKTDKVHSVPWSQVQEMKVKGLLAKKLRIVAQSNMRHFKAKMKIPNTFFGLLAPIQDNVQNARVLEQQFSSMRSLPPGPAAAQYGSLPPAAPQMAQPGYGQMQQLPQPPGAPQQPQQPQQQGGWPYPQPSQGPNGYYPQA